MKRRALELGHADLTDRGGDEFQLHFVNFIFFFPGLPGLPDLTRKSVTNWRRLLRGNGSARRGRNSHPSFPLSTLSSGHGDP